MAVVLDVFVVEGATLAVFEPLLGGLVAADVEVPGHVGDSREVLGLVDMHLVPGTRRLLDFVAPGGRIGNGQCRVV